MVEDILYVVADDLFHKGASDTNAGRKVKRASMRHHNCLHCASLLVDRTGMMEETWHVACG